MASYVIGIDYGTLSGRSGLVVDTVLKVKQKNRIVCHNQD